MRKPFAILLLLAASSLFGQQIPEKAGPAHRLICTPVPRGKVLKSVMPVYAQEVTAKAIAQGVVVALTIDKHGVPRDLHLTKGDPILAKAALEALRQWRWRPYTLNGEPVEVESSVYIRFEPARE